MDNKTLEFVTYCISKLAQVLRLSQREVYHRLKASGILDEYIIPSYDVLHTFSSRYLVEDLTDYMREKGVLYAIYYYNPTPVAAMAAGVGVYLADILQLCLLLFGEFAAAGDGLVIILARLGLVGRTSEGIVIEHSRPGRACSVA